MNLRSFLILTVLAAGCVEQLPAAGQFLDHADVAGLDLGEDAAIEDTATDTATDTGEDVAETGTGMDVPSDAAPDDAGADAGLDAGPDAAVDAQGDTEADVPEDTGADVATDAAPDAVPDAQPDAAPDTAPDAALDVAPDVGPDAEPDALADTAADTSPDVAEDIASDTVDVAPDVPGSDTPQIDAAPGEDVEADVLAADDAQAEDSTDVSAADTEPLDSSPEPDVVGDILPDIQVNPGEDTADVDDTSETADSSDSEDSADSVDSSDSSDADDAAVEADVPLTCPLGCDDANPCTDDDCQAGACVHTANSAVCDDDDACTTNDVCAGKQCSGVAQTCSDGNSCTTDSCDKIVGCTFPPLTGPSCDDVDACTTSNSCAAGQCIANAFVTCLATLPCHADGTCDSATGQCSDPAKEDGASCSDDSGCTENDACSGGACVGAPVLWSQQLGTGVEHAVSAVVGLADGGVIVALQTLSGGTAGIDTTVSRIDSLGNTLWSKDFATTGDEFLNDGVLSGTTAAFVGFRASQSGSWFLALNIADGSTAAQTYGAAESSAIVVDGSGYATVGGRFLRLLNSNGSLKASYEYGTPLDASYTRLAATANGGWVFSGTIPNGCCGTSGHIRGVNSTGQTLWTATLDDAKAATSIPVGVSALPGGSVNVVNRAFSNPDSAYVLYMHRFNGAGAEEWQRQVGTINNSKEPAGFLALDGGCVVSGYTKGAPIGLFALQLDAAGNTLWEIEPKQGDTWAQGSAIAAAGQGFWIGGKHDTDGPRQGHLQRIDGFGHTTCATAGDCAVKTLGACSDGNLCTSDGCSAGVCSHGNLSEGAPCDDGNACSQTDTCQGGACSGGDPVVCPAVGFCQEIGTCNTATGVCSAATNKPNNTPCSDDNACTPGDSCQGGSCTPGTATVCTASDSCHDAGTCDTVTGLCSNPVKSNGSSCSDSSGCTANDTCTGGSCTGSPVLWSQQLGTGVEHAMTAVAGLDDGGAVVAMQAMNGGSAGIDTTVSRIDSTGNTLWTKTFATNGDDILNDGLQNGTTVAFVGYRGSQNGSWFLALNIADGSTAAQTYGAANEAAIVVDGTGYATVGGRLLNLLNGDGSLKASYAFNTPLDLNYTRLAATANGGWVLSGTVPNGCCGTSGHISGVNSSGQTLWTATLDDAKAGTSIPVGVSALPGGGVNVVNRAYSIPDFAYVLYMHRINNAGAEEWQRQVGSIMNSKEPGGFLARGGGCVVTGFTKFAPIGLFALELDLAGNTLWEIQPKQGDTWAQGSAIAAAGEGFWIGGKRDTEGPRQGHLQRIDGFGHTTCAAAGDCAAKVLGACSDGNLCTSDGCSGGVCTHSDLSAGTLCDDANACTLDTCNASGGCQHANVGNGLACEDGSACTVADSCQSGACTAGPTGTFSIAQGIDYYAQFRGVAATSAGYAFAGRAHGTDNIWMLITNLSGTPLVTSDKQMVNLGGFEELSGVAALGNNWAFVGQKDNSPDPGDGLLYVLAADGTTKITSQTYGGTGTDFFSSVAVRSSGLVMCGSSNSPGTSDNTDFWLVTTDLDGMNPDSHYFHHATTSYQDCYSVIVAANGDIVMAGRADDGGWVVRTDAAGNKLWDKRIAGLASYTALRTVVEYGGNLYAAGTLANASGVGDVWLVALSAAGDVLWQKTYGSAIDDDRGWGLTATGDGFLITGRTAGFGATGNDGFVVRTDVYGNELWHQRLSKPANSAASGNSEELRGAAMTPTGFVVAGTDSTNGWGDGWIVKLDTWGHDSCAGAGPCGTLATPACDDGNPCTADTCVGPGGTCSHTSLSDGATCGDGKTCSAGTCQ